MSCNYAEGLMHFDQEDEDRGHAFPRGYPHTYTPEPHTLSNSLEELPRRVIVVIAGRIYRLVPAT